MKRTWLTCVCAAAIAAICLSSAGISDAGAVSSDTPVTRVTVVLAPYLTFDDLTPENTPALLRMVDDGAIAAANVRGRVRGVAGLPSPTESALGISSGAWSLPEPEALAAFDRNESYEGTAPASQAYRRVYGTGMGTALIGYLGLPATQRTNDLRSTDVVLGTLGQSIEDAGGFTAAVGNSDIGYEASGVRFERPAAVASADMDGRIHYGDVSAGLLLADPSAPYGRRTDLEEFSGAFSRVDQLAKAHRGPSLIVLDPGDLTRAQEFASAATTLSASVDRRAALATFDRVVAMAEARRGTDGVVLVISQALNTDENGDLQGMGPCVVTGGGLVGYLSSASTHRPGVVTNLDVTATVLDQLGIDRPVQVLGNAMISTPAPASATERVAHLTALNSKATSVDGAKAGVLNVYIGLAVLVLLLAGLVLWRAQRWRVASVESAAGALMYAVLFLLSVPVASWLMFVVAPYPESRVTAVVALLGVSLLVWVASIVLLRRSVDRMPVIVLAGVTAFVMLAEQFFGAPLSFVNFFGYSPLPAARFYGMGNESASVLFGASLTGLALLLDQYPDARWSGALRKYGIAALGVVVVGVAAAPFLGANVGVAIWGSIGFGLAWLLMNGKRVTWRTVAALLVGVVLVIGAFAAIDLLGGGEQTHLARSLTSAQSGGIEQLWTIVVRKAETNIRVFTHTNWSWVLIAVLVFLGFVRLRPTGDFAAMLAENPRFGDAITVTLTAGAIAFFTEDSGIVIPALIMLYTGAGTVWLMLTRLKRAGEGSR